MITLPINLQARGRFRVLVKNTETGEVRKHPWQDNLITNIGLARMFDSSFIAWGEYMHVGTGAGVAEGDTTLSSWLATVKRGEGGNDYRGGNSGSSPYIAFSERDYIFPQGDFADNTTLSELGVGPTNSGASSQVHTKAQIDPAIVVNQIDQVTVQYRFDFYVDEGDINGIIDIQGGGPIGVNYTQRAADCDSATWVSNQMFPSRNAVDGGFGHTMTLYNNATSIGPITGNPLGATQTDSRTIFNAWGPETGLNNRTWTHVWPINDGNLSNITAIKMDTPFGEWQWFFDQGFAKDNTQTLTFSFTYSISRFTP